MAKVRLHLGKGLGTPKPESHYQNPGASAGKFRAQLASLIFDPGDWRL